jgi:hypothetical protein
MPALTQDINSTAFTSTVIGNNYADSGYGFSAVNGKAVSSGTYSVLARSQTTNVHRVRVNAKPQEGLGIFCSATNYASTPSFAGILFEVKVSSGKTFFRLSAISSSATVTKEAAGSLVSECPMPSSMSTSTAYEFELTTGRYGWQVTYLKNTKRAILIQLPILSESSISGSQTDTYFKSSSATWCGVVTSKSGVKIDSLSIWYGGNQGNPYGATLNLFNCVGTASPSINFVPSSFATNLTAASSLAGFSLTSSGIVLSTTKTSFINSMTNATSDGISTEDIPVVVISFEVVSGNPVISLDHGGTTKNLYFNSTIDGGTSHAFSEETGGDAF